eukprot:RCo004249
MQQKASPLSHVHPADGDGISVALFYVLSKENRKLESACVDIVQSVYFEGGFAKVWFMNQRVSEKYEVKKRVGKDIDLKAVLQVFTRGTHATDVVATFTEVNAQLAERDTCRHPVQVLTNADLEAFLLGRNRKPTGMLQQFISPKGHMNSVMVQVVWSPHVFLCEGRMNSNNLRDSRVAAFRRAFTFEAAAAGEEPPR